MSSALFTIGHSRHDPEKFLRLLEAQGIQAVADVRTRAFQPLLSAV